MVYRGPSASQPLPLTPRLSLLALRLSPLPRCPSRHELRPAPSAVQTRDPPWPRHPRSFHHPRRTPSPPPVGRLLLPPPAAFCSLRQQIWPPSSPSPATSTSPTRPRRRVSRGGLGPLRQREAVVGSEIQRQAVSRAPAGDRLRLRRHALTAGRQPPRWQTKACPSSSSFGRPAATVSWCSSSSSVELVARTRGGGGSPRCSGILGSGRPRSSAAGAVTSPGPNPARREAHRFLDEAAGTDGEVGGGAAGVDGEAGTTELQARTARWEAELQATSLPPLLQFSTAAGGNCRNSLRKGSGCTAGVLTLLSGRRMGTIAGDSLRWQGGWVGRLEQGKVSASFPSADAMNLQRTVTR
jgi:hypothetical protein